MRRPRFADISIFTLKYIFNWRFWIAEITKKSKTYKKVIDKMAAVMILQGYLDSKQ